MWQPYLLTAVALLLVALVGRWATDIGPWYQELDKPPWNLPPWVFGPVWLTIYLFITASVGQAWSHGEPADRQTLLGLVGVNFVLNMLWSVFFFKLRRPAWALVDVVALWLSSALLMVEFHGYHPLSAWLLLPYLVWVSVAAALNASILKRNPEFAQV